MDFVNGLQAYQKRLKAWESCNHEHRFDKEQNTLVKFVVPLLELLGWNSQSPAVSFEYPIEGKRKRRGKRVDCALYLRGEVKPRLLVEVKPYQLEVKPYQITGVGPPQQVFKYLSLTNVPYGITTNGRTVVVYDSRYVPRRYRRAKLLFWIHADDFVKHAQLLRVLSKEAVQRGSLDRLAKRFRRPYFDWCKQRGFKPDAYDARLRFAELELRGLGAAQ